MITVLIAIVVVVVLLAASYYYWYTSQNTKWTAFKEGNGYIVLRKVKGNVECAAVDGRNCTRFAAQAPAVAAADAYNAADSVGLKPLACGEAHKKLYGNTGYDERADHWCNTKF
jgi:flagellar basal body-associated protein FliL